MLRNGAQLVISVPLPAEALEIVTFLNQAGGESGFLAFGAGGYVYSVDEQKGLIEACRERADGYMLNARIEEMLVANLYLFPLTRDFQVAEFGLCVARSHWGQGIGSQLLSRAVAWARHRGLREIRLMVHHENLAAHALYARHGFVKDHALDTEQGVAMRLFLTDKHATARHESPVGQA